MGKSKKRRGYQPPSISRSLDPYHYPLDADGNPTPTPSPRSRSGNDAPTEVEPSRPVDEPEVTHTEEHITVDLTAEETDDAQGSADDSIAGHFARIVLPAAEPDDTPGGDPDRGTAHAG